MERLVLWREAFLDKVENGKYVPMHDHSIALSMERDKHGCFAGFGRHLVTDFLHHISCHPATSLTTLITTDENFARFANDIQVYMAQWRCTDFIERVCTRPGSANPFAFRKESNNNYFANYVTCYRLSYAVMEESVFVDNAEQGLYDHNHTIGE